MRFPTTQWTLLARASLHGDAAARNALEELCKRYWCPLFGFIRGRGYSEAEAQDLTQDFLLHVLENSTLQRADRQQGKFRSFLLGALVRFLCDQYDKRRAQKRGGGLVHVEVDEVHEQLGSSDETAFTFDREWACVILENALLRIEEEWKSKKAIAGFQVFRQFLPGAIATPSYEDACQEIGLTVASFKSELHRLRQRLKEVIRQEVGRTVSAPHEVEDELLHFQQVLLDRSNEPNIRAKLLGPFS